MLPAIAGFKFKGNSAGLQNWTAAKLPFRARDTDVPDYSYFSIHGFLFGKGLETFIQ
jgi:hypothetical protein